MTPSGPPVVEAYLLQLHGQNVGGVGVVEIDSEVRGALLRYCSHGLSRDRSTIAFRGERRDALYFDKLWVELLPSAFDAWTLLSCHMLAEKTVTLQLGGSSGKLSTWSRSACATKALELKPDSATSWNNLAWYAHCDGLKEVSFQGEVMSTTKCAAIALSIDSGNASAWDTLGIILGYERYLSPEAVPSNHSLANKRRKFIEEFPRGESLSALDCFSRHLRLKLKEGRNPHCSFLHSGLVLAHRNAALGAPLTNPQVFFQPSAKALCERLSQQLPSLKPPLLEEAKAIAERLVSIDCELHEKDCYVLALAFDEEGTLVTMLTSDAHLQRSKRFFDCVGGFLSACGKRIVRKYS